MKSTEILNLFSRFEAAAAEYEGIECWSARDLQPLLGYSKWENFSKVIEKAKESCSNAGGNVSDHFPDIRKMVSIGSGAEKSIEDIHLVLVSCQRYYDVIASLRSNPEASNQAWIASCISTLRRIRQAHRPQAQCIASLNNNTSTSSVTAYQ